MSSYLTPAQVAGRYCLRAGQRMSQSTVTRWIMKGLIGPTGDRIRLKAIRVGRAIAIDPHDLEQFFGALAEARDGEAPIRSPAERRNGDSRAAKELDALGIGT